MTEQNQAGIGIRRCGRADADDILVIINAAAEVYRGVIPSDRWKDRIWPPTNWRLRWPMA
jgi:hypothetical protein